MATSGTITYSLNRNAIATKILRILNVYGKGSQLLDEDVDLVVETLNLLLAEWQSRGAHTWAVQEGTLIPTSGTAEYSLPGSYASDNLVKTEISATEASGQTAISVDSSAGMSVDDVIGIEQDDGTIHWSTIASVDSSVQVTINDATTDSAAVDNHVYAYTTAANRPFRISHMRAKNAGGNEIEIRMISRTDYNNITDKDSTGTPNQCYYQPGLDTGTLKLYPVPSDSKLQIKYTYERTLEIFSDTTTDTPDLPREVYSALIWNGALRCAPEFEVSESKIKNIIEPNAIQTLELAFGGDFSNDNLTIIWDV